ncbi:hypothetical protein KEC55_30650 [Burkholderia cepacia]|uniref:hypothetical protein n=1 Tax=Burkholderia cepacia TaxID=292 RepID=UPI00249F43D5|nr:hypothetical protein [Burkholderia cepacia]WGY71351.1 hypothetical protein KEC55_30650 [Burkholderia cepacia]
MRKQTMRKWLCVILMLPIVAHAQRVILTGKMKSAVTAHVTRPNNLFVTNDAGGWFDQGLEMQQLGGWETPYEVQARLKIVSSSGTFQVYLDSPLTITHQSTPELAFRTPTVRLGIEGGVSRPLQVGLSTEFQNPSAPVEGVDSVGYYNLDISAYPPAGDFKSTTGTYSGVLSITFEPVITAP